MMSELVSKHENRNSILVHEPHGLKKMSEIILEFVQEDFEVDQTFEDKQKIITSAILAWNLSLFNPLRRIIEMRKLCSQVKVEGKDAVGALKFLMGALIRRKQKMFPDVKRLIIDYQFFELKRPGDCHLNVVSTVLKNSKADRSGIPRLKEILSDLEGKTSLSP